MRQPEYDGVPDEHIPGTETLIGTISFDEEGNFIDDIDEEPVYDSPIPDKVWINPVTSMNIF